MIVFVTGGSRGVGRAIVQAALRDGHDVAFTYRENLAAAERVVAWAGEHAPARTCRAYPLDVSDSAAVEQTGDRVLDELGTVHAVISNAGVVQNGLAVHMSDEAWLHVLNTNLSGGFYVARYFLPTFLANGGGRFVFIGSIAQDGISGQANYSASKAGLVGLAKSLAKEYGRKGITANVVVAGFFDTDMTREHMAGPYKEFWMKHCPAGRVGRAEEAARVALFLASDAASFVNGSEIPVSGGLDWAA